MIPSDNLRKSLRLSVGFYTRACVVLVTVLLLFLLANGIALIIVKRYDASVPLPRPDGKLVYPSRSPSEIHQLLQETWTRPHTFEPFVQFRERPFAGKYINVANEGFRLGKNQRPWPPDFCNDYVVFVFGGSTTFGYGLSDNETVASYLQECMRKASPNVSVYNFACGFYYSSQERVLFERLIEDGFRPHMAVFIDGFNEFYHTDRGPRHSEALGAMMDGPCSAGLKQCVAKLPLTSLVYRFATSSRGISGPEAKDADSAALTRCLNRYLSNKRIIEAVGKGFGIKCRFIWQPVPSYGYDSGYQAFFKELKADVSWAHNYCKLGYPVAKQLYVAGAFGENFCWCAEIQRGRNEPLYVDAVHYTAHFARDLAAAICDCVSK